MTSNVTRVYYNKSLSDMTSSSGIDIQISADNKNSGIMDTQPSSSSSSLDKKSQNASNGNEDVQVNSVTSCSLENDSIPFGLESSKCSTKISERAKGKSWYHAVYPSYKSRSSTFHKLFSGRSVPDDQRLIVDYSCALQREILVHGRMFVSQDYLCFHANIFGWETYLCLKWTNITAITKEKTALVIPNAILLSTEQEKYFMTSFAARDKTYLMLFRIWQNALMGKSMTQQEIWQCVHNVYGEQLGLTSDDEDYIDPKDQKYSSNEAAAQDNNSRRNLPISSDIESDQSVDKRAKGKYSSGNNTGSATIDSNTSRSTQSKLRMRKDDPDYIPTDASYTTDSEEENSVPFVCTAECTSMHEGRELVKTILPINVESTFTLLFSKSKFFAEFHSKRKTTNIVYRDWVDNDDGTKCRTINFTVAITQAVGPKSCNMTEVQVMRNCSVPGQLYSIDMTSTNAGIPYADSFHTSTHFCLVRTVDDHTMLSVYVQIKYTKSVWGVVKGFIEKNVWNGLEDFYKSLCSALQTEYSTMPPAKSKSRRTKRAMTQKVFIEEAPSKRSSLKSNQKVVDIQTATPLASSTMYNHRTSSPISIPDQTTKRNFLTFDTFSMAVVILIFVLVLLNVYLFIQLYVLKVKHDDEISISRLQLDQMMATSDPNELKENWMKLLNQQKTSHHAELVKWQGFVKSAADLLQKVKEVYSKFSLELNESENSSNIKDEF